jgi:autotransporter-associated beta strand protein
MASESAPACEFAGRLTGKFSVNSYAGLSLSGTESDISKLQILRRAPGDHMNNGYVAMSRLGCKNEVSSIGTGPLYLLYCSSFRYLGDGETSDKNIYYDTRTLTGSPDAIIFDGGPNGGLNLTGSISSYGNTKSMMTLILDGSNSVACTVSGGFTASFAADADDVAYTPYILKRGSGVWRFADNANRTHAGVYEVREGTLQFDTIAEAGEMCSLGFATNLSENYQGAYDSRRKAPYAYRLGSPDSTNAVFEYTGSVPGICATRPAVLSGNAHIRASGAKGAPLDFSGVSALSEGSFTLVLDGANGETNILRDVTDGAGQISLVKDGPGSWTLGGRQSFSGSLTVKQGTLTVAGPRPFTYFRATFNDGYGSPYTSYITEVGLYDASGVRRNLNLAFELPAGKRWTDSWTPNNVAPLLPEGGISYDGGGNLAYYLYGPDDYALGKLTDATSASAQFSRALSPSSPLTVSMRLPSDVPEIAYFDFVQNSGNYLSEGHQTPSACVLEGSVDGLTWTTLLSTNNLEHIGGDKWRFSVSGQKLSEYPGDRDVAAGEALAFSSRAAEPEIPMLENVGTVSVSSGATLRTTGLISPVVDSLAVDGVSGSGTITGFTFADNVTVNVTGRPRNSPSGVIAIDFSGCKGFDKARWTFLETGSLRCAGRSG